MKKLILSILFILCLSFQASAWCPTTVLSGTSETAIACSSCTPGDPSDIFCEDGENSGDHWCSWADQVSSGNSVTFAGHSDTLSCTDKGDYAIVFDVDGSNGELAALGMSISATGVFYAKFYVNITAMSYDSGTQFEIMTLEGSTAWLVGLYFGHEDGNEKFRMYVNGQGGNLEVDGPNISTGTWYKVELFFTKNSADAAGAYFKVDGTQYSLSGDSTENINVDHVDLGSDDRSYAVDATDTITFEMDIIKTDEDATPGDCAS